MGDFCDDFSLVIDKANAIRKQVQFPLVKDIADFLGVNLIFSDKLIDLKGVYYANMNIRLMVINENLPLSLKNTIIAHELGHDQLHRMFSYGKTFTDCFDDNVFSDTVMKEIEANVFAATLLIPDESLLEYIKRNGKNVEKIVDIYKVKKELVLVKLRLLKDNYK